MMRSRALATVVPVALALVSLTSEGRAAFWAFSGQLEVRASAGLDPSESPVLSVPISGTAEIVGGVLKLPAGIISAPFPGALGFGGTLVNADGSFSPGGAEPGSTCPLVAVQEICIGGSGFGGSMRLEGGTQNGQSLVQLGIPGTHVGMTTAGLSRSEAGTHWTHGAASAWYFIYEIDITPFAILSNGSFRGLPSTFTGTGPAGLTLVTPMRVTSSETGSEQNVRAMARLRIDFEDRAVPNAVALGVAALLVAIGAMKLRALQPDARLR